MQDKNTFVCIPDECLTTTHGCAQICINTAGSYHCKCSSGHLNTDGKTCSGQSCLCDHSLLK